MADNMRLGFRHATALIGCVLAGIVAMSFSIADWSALGISVDLAPNAGLEVSPAELSFGTVWAQPDFVWPVTIRNQSNRRIRIAGFEASCSCLKIEPKSLELAGGESSRLLLTLDLSARSLSSYDETVSPVSISFRPVIDSSPPVCLGWMLSGEVRSAFPGLPGRIDLRDPLITGLEWQAMDYRVVKSPLVESFSVECDPSILDVTIKKGATQQAFDTLVLRPKPLQQRDMYVADLTLVAYLKDGSVLPPQSVELHGRICPDPEPTPRELHLGSGALASSLVGFVKFACHSPDGFTLERIINPSECISVSRDEASVGKALSFRVVQSVVATGSQESAVTFVFKSKGGLRNEIIVPVRYYGRDDLGKL